jgi:hypothetical protein
VRWHFRIGDTKKHRRLLFKLERSRTATNYLRVQHHKWQIDKMSPKKKISDNTRRKMIEGYEKGADEDLEITKDFEAIEKELDEDCDK